MKASHIEYVLETATVGLVFQEDGYMKNRDSYGLKTAFFRSVGKAWLRLADPEERRKYSA